MTEAEMRRALELVNSARSIRRELDTWVLLRRDYSTGETILLGEPINAGRPNEYHRHNVPIPAAARQHVFKLWRKGRAETFNQLVRELNQLGAAHEFQLIQFSPATGEPL